MDSSDAGTFDTAFGRVSGAFSKIFKAGELEPMKAAYFRALAPFPISAVVAAGDECIRTLKRFPRVADWRQAIRTSGPVPRDVREMTAHERTEQERARQLGYRNAPCACGACVAAGVSDREIRFVPTLWPDGTEETALNGRQAVEVVGHWAHGAELARWYTARDAFFRLAAGKGPRVLHHERRRRPFADRLAEIFGDRDPGEEG